MDFSPNDPISLFHEDILTDLNHFSHEASNGGLNEFLSQQTIEGDENAEWLSVFVEDCLSSSPSNYNFAPASEQVITKTCNPRTVGNLKPQPLFNSSLTVKNPSEKPSLKRKKKTVSVMELKTHKTQSNSSLKTPSNVRLDHSLEPELELEYDPDPPLLQQAHWLADSELIFPMKKDSHVKEEYCTEEERTVDVGSSSPEVYIEPKFDMKENMLKPRSCTHCQSKRTPLWREGPLGKGTLCNACGLRWLKSGNLFPEYRPVNSPTFVSNRHSNVLRQVLKMREDHHSSSADIITNFSHGSEEGADNGPSELLPPLTTEGVKKSECLSVFVEDCYTCPGNWILNPANQQVITLTSDLKPLETLQRQLHKPEKPTKRRRTISVRNLQTRKTPSTSWSNSYNSSPALKPDAKPPLHQQARRFGDSECHFASQQSTVTNKEPRAKETVEHVAVSQSPELYIKHKSEKKMSRARQPSKRLADCELDFPLKQNSASKSCTEDKKKNATKQRRCTHCQMTETPMWREGPSGKGTLCNACGLMWLKSRTLFPEYRPANSPTFVSNLHSNVLHKVLKMRVAHQSSGAS